MPVLKAFDLTGKTALVTGASRGLGQAIAVGLAEAGAGIVLVDKEDCQTTLEYLAAIDSDAIQIQQNLECLTPAGATDLIQEALNKNGSLDILINNAGIVRRKPTIEHTEQDWREVVGVNLDAVFFLCQAMGQYLLSQKRSGKIINIASLLSYQGGLLVPSYTATKSAIAGLTKALANEWAPFNINVNAIAPGYFSTAVTAGIRENANRSREILSRIPAGRWGNPGDLKGASVFLSSDASAYIHGAILAVDGGWLAR